jgi:hypothetical protein
MPSVAALLGAEFGSIHSDVVIPVTILRSKDQIEKQGTTDSIRNGFDFEIEEHLLTESGYGCSIYICEPDCIV